MSSGGLTALFSAGFLGGSELFNLEYLQDVRDRGVLIDAVIPEDGHLAEALRPLARSLAIVEVPPVLRELSRFDSKLPIKATSRRTLAVFAYARRIRAAVREMAGPICCFGFRAQLALGVQPPIPGRPLVWVIHEVVPESPFGRIWGAVSGRPVSVLSYSRTAAEQPLLRRARVQVTSPSLDLDAFVGQSPPQHPPSRLALIGDLFPLKNHMGFIDLVRTLRLRGFEVEGLIVGRRNDSRQELSTYAELVVGRTSEPGSHVRVTECRHEEMPAAFAQTDLLLHLTTVPETFGRVCVEAMAAGRPVVGFRHGGVAEVVEHERTGLLVRPGDLQAVASAVERLWRDPRLYRDLSASAATRARERFGTQSGRATIGSSLADLAGRSSA
jgi:glycosyltransferase involved in cell wall biosynthesis